MKFSPEEDWRINQLMNYTSLHKQASYNTSFQNLDYIF